MLESVKRYQPYAPLLLRLGLGFIFLWSAFGKLLADADALGVCTNRQEAISLVGSFLWLPISPELFVTIQSWVELVLGLILVLGLWVELAAGASAVLFVLFFIFLDFDLVWKNVALLGASLALVVLPKNSFRWDIKQTVWWRRRLD